MTLGLIILVAIVILTLLGLMHRVFDRMRLTDSQALLFILLVIIGSFINLHILRGTRDIFINIGGGILPIILAFYVLGKADTAREKWRALGAVVVTAAVLYGLNKLMVNYGHGRGDIIDPIYIYGIVGGIVAYLISRSRRLAFISATLGVLLLDLIHMVELFVLKTPGQVMIGGAGAFDAIILAGIIATLLAETIGETRERMAGGPEEGDELPEGIKDKGREGK